MNGIPRDVLLANVEEFAEQKGLQHVLPQLKKGALLAQSPVGSICTTIPGLLLNRTKSFPATDQPS